MNINEVFEKQGAKSLELRTDPIKARIRRLKDLRDWILANRTRIQEAVYKDLRKPQEEVDLCETWVTLGEVRKAIRNLKYWVMPKPESTSLAFIGTKAEVYYEPKGRALIISPWNYPFNLGVNPLISAIAAGNTVLLKPSEISTHTSLLLKEMVEELFDDDLVAVFTGGVDVSTELLKLPFDHIFFTGSPRVGKIVMEAASKHLASVTLELGGKSPCIVDESVNIKDAAKKIAWGKWLNAGQTCVAPDYVFVHEKIKTSFLEQLQKEAEILYGGEGSYTSIISEDHYNRLSQWKDQAVEAGARVSYEAESNPETRRMGPSIVEDVGKGTHLNENEIFGPICMVKSFTDIDEAIDLVNSRPKALAAYIFARNKKVVEQFKRRTSAGSFAVNDTVIQFGHPSMPFGGVNNSGIGKSHGRYGFLEFSNQKSILKQRVGFTMAKNLYPPYNKFKRLNIDFLLKYF
ncbi:MAG: aldehyde dehydrogenase family protein [Cytophagales bacterium]|nr:aldehyde dehydrogenase family protein [Cytophagales bacterium]